MIAASFCPCLIKPAVSIRLIKESGPVPSRAGRYIGNFAVCDDGTSTCDQPRSTIDNKTTAEIPKMRMGQIRNRNGGHFQPQSRLNLRRRCRSILGGYLVHDLVAPKIIDHCIACLDRMKGAAGRSLFEQGAQPHDRWPALRESKVLKAIK